MKNLRFILAATFFAAIGCLQAAGTIKTYVVEAAFGADETVDWSGLGETPRGENALQLSRAFSRATSATGSVAVSGSVAAGTLKRTDNVANSFRNSFSDGRLLTTNANSGPLTVTFTSGAVMGVGVQIQANAAASFTARMNIYDAAGNLLGTTTVTNRPTARASDSAPFMGMRSSVREIAKVEIDASSDHGYTISGLRLALNPVNDNNLFVVNQLFQDLYGRVPTPAELTGNLNALKQGTVTRAQIAASMFDSPEFHDNAGFLVKCYLALMQRDADFVQWSQILRVMQGGATQDSALAAFMGTPEYAAAYPDSLSDGAFVMRLHQKLLGREPESGELNMWASKLAQGGSRRNMVQAFLRSPEFEVRIGGRVTASLGYLAFLRRAGEPAGMNRWIDALKSGASRTEVISAFLALPEYAARF